MISPVAQSPERTYDKSKKSLRDFRDRSVGDYESDKQPDFADFAGVTNEMPQAMYFNAATNSISG